MKITTFTLVIATIIGVWPEAARAQSHGGQYTPSRPTVSPYLNLLRRDGGPATNYYTQVRPQQQQQAINQQQNSLNLQQQSLLRTQQQGLARVQTGLLEIRQPQASPTGTGGGFMNFSHFYAFPQSGPARR